jgi:hypothetical protein
VEEVEVDGGGAAAEPEKFVEETLEGGISHRTCTGEVVMRDDAKDIKVISFSLSFHGQNIIEVRSLLPPLF